MRFPLVNDPSSVIGGSSLTGRARVIIHFVLAMATRHHGNERCFPLLLTRTHYKIVLSKHGSSQTI